MTAIKMPYPDGLTLCGYLTRQLSAANPVAFSATTDALLIEDSRRVLGSSQSQSRTAIGGSYEVQHLGNSIRSMVSAMRRLMDDIIRQEESRKEGARILFRGARRITPDSLSFR